MLSRSVVLHLYANGQRDFRERDYHKIDLSPPVDPISGNKFQSGLYLAEADFTGCTLYSSDFTKCVLIRAKFNSSDLRSAKFNQSDLRGASFVGADMRGAWLAADLSGADFSGTDLSETDLSGAFFLYTKADRHTVLPPGYVVWSGYIVRERVGAA